MAKYILMSIKPKYVSMILNKTKIIEVRKRFPSDYVGWVYIYCTKDYHDRLYFNGSKYIILPRHALFDDICFNGKVVARFWCDKVEKIRSYLEPEQWYMTSDLGGSGLLQKSCLTFKELDDYLLSGKGYAIHITKLEIFDKPKELKEFKYVCPNVLCDQCKYGNKEIDFSLPICKRQITRAPQSWCYVEV